MTDTTLRLWLGALEERYDPGTKRLLLERGLRVGWRCWEVGAGAGSIAVWLADQVRPSGTVLATDTDTRFLASLAHPNLVVRSHDVVTTDLPAGPFDLIHARLVLEALPNRQAVLGNLAAALAAGGWLVLEEKDNVSVVPAPRNREAAALYQKVRQAVVTYVAQQRHDPDAGSYGRQLVGSLQAGGLTEIGAEGRVFMAQGGDPSAKLGRLLYDQVGTLVVASGAISAVELPACLALHDDPNFLVMTPILMAAWGRRPAPTLPAS